MIKNIWIWLLFPCIFFSFIRLRLQSKLGHFKQSLKILFSLRKPLLKEIDNLSPIVLFIVIPIFAIVIYTFFGYTRESLKSHKYSFILLRIYTIVLVLSLALFLLMIRALIKHLQAIYFTHVQMKKTSEAKDKQQMPCVCTNYFVNDSDFYKNLSISSYTCQYCDIKFELPTTDSLMNIEDFKLMLINKHKSIMLELSSQLESKLNEHAEKCAEFSLTQADHFENIRRDIDIARETLLQKIYDNNKSVNSSKEEQIQKQSIDMIKQVECTEEAFRANINREIQRKQNDLISIVCDFDLNEQRNLENIQNHKLKIESRLDLVQKQLNRFKLFEYDLVRNKFQHASKNDKNNDESNLGQLFLFKTFLTEDSQHLITYAKECNEIQIWDVNTASLIDKRYSKVTCFCLDEKTSIICGFNLGEIKIYDISSNRQVFS
jgi:TRAP-type mannitol/chloroaromatic compound transport system permease small subunit